MITWTKERDTFVGTTPKMQGAFQVHPDLNGYGKYEIKFTRGKTPFILCGLFSTVEDAKAAAQKHEDTMKDTKGARRRETFKRVDARKAEREAKHGAGSEADRQV
jgi:hypothetical protein